MLHETDNFDRKILNVLQSDAACSIESVSEKVGLSRNACWRRIKRLEKEGVIKNRVTLLDRQKLGLELSVFVMIRVGRHEPDWIEKFDIAIKRFPQIIGAYRMSGDLDYILHVVVENVSQYDRFYQNLIKQISIGDVSASFVMDSIVETTNIPLR